MAHRFQHQNINARIGTKRIENNSMKLLKNFPEWKVTFSG